MFQVGDHIQCTNDRVVCDEGIILDEEVCRYSHNRIGLRYYTIMWRVPGKSGTVTTFNHPSTWLNWNYECVS